MKILIKIIRTVIGLPFAIMMWLILAPLVSLVCLPKWIIYGRLTINYTDDLDGRMWLEAVTIPYSLLKNIWGK